MPASDIRSIVFVMFVAALGTVPGVQAADTALEAFAGEVGITVGRTAQPGVGDRRAVVAGAPSALDAFVKQVGFDVTAIPREVRREWVNSSRAASLPHELFCPVHSGGEVRAENASAAVDHAHLHAHSPAGARME